MRALHDCFHGDEDLYGTSSSTTPFPLSLLLFVFLLAPAFQLLAPIQNVIRQRSPRFHPSFFALLQGTFAALPLLNNTLRKDSTLITFGCSQDDDAYVMAATLLRYNARTDVAGRSGCRDLDLSFDWRESPVSEGWGSCNGSWVFQWRGSDFLTQQRQATCFRSWENGCCFHLSKHDNEIDKAEPPCNLTQPHARISVKKRSSKLPQLGPSRIAPQIR